MNRLRKLSSGKLAPVLVFALIGLLFTWPVFKGLHNWGIQDWDQHLFYHGVPRATLLEYGQAPLWNPYYVGGTVLLANPQSRIVTPSFPLILLLGEVVGLKVEIWLYLVVGLLGTYGLARHYGLAQPAALLAACVFMLNSMYALALTVGMTWMMSVPYLPWAFLFYLKAREDSRYALAGGLCLALMFLSGGAYPLAITLLFLAVYTGLLLVARQERPLKLARVLGVMLGFMLAVGAVKFLPTMEFLRQYPRLIFDYSGYSLNSLQFSLFSRDQSLAAIVKLPVSQSGFLDGVTGGMDENGMYIGLVPILLGLAGAVSRDKRRLALVAVGLFFLWLSFGNRPRLELWTWLHLLPVYSSMRIAQRFRIVWLLALALLAGFGLHSVADTLAQRTGRPALASGAAWLAAAGVLLDLGIVNGAIFYDAFPISPLAVSRSDRFYQVWELPAYDTNGWLTARADKAENPLADYNPFGMYSSYGALYPAFLANLGTINGYETAEVPRYAVPADSPDYRGEAYLASTAGQATITAWSPNRVVVAVDPAGPGWLVLNQNYYPGWQVEGSTGPAVEPLNGLLAVRVAPGDREVTLSYRPLSFTMGLVVTMVTLVLTGSWFLLVPKLWPAFQQGRGFPRA